MRINPYVYGVLVLAIFLGTIFGFQAAGIWSISGKVTGSGEAVQPAADDVNTIKGWMTLEQISTVYNVPLAELLAQFNLPADTPPGTAIKDLETESFSVSNLRAWLQSRMEAEPAATALPESTPAPTATPAATEAVATPLPTEHTGPADKTVTGKTTFQDLLDWGLTQATIETVIGGEMPAPATLVKDYATQLGQEFAPLKAALQAEVDQLK